MCLGLILFRCVEGAGRTLGGDFVVTEDISVYERSCGAGEGAIAMAADMVEDLVKVLGRIHCNVRTGKEWNSLFLRLARAG